MCYNLVASCDIIAVSLLSLSFVLAQYLAWNGCKCSLVVALSQYKDPSRLFPQILLKWEKKQLIYGLFLSPHLSFTFIFHLSKDFVQDFLIFGGFTKDYCGVENGLVTEERTLCFSSKSKLS